MNNREVPGDVGRHLVARIVSSYVKHNRVAADELQTMIASVHQSRSAGRGCRRKGRGSQADQCPAGRISSGHRLAPIIALVANLHVKVAAHGSDI